MRIRPGFWKRFGKAGATLVTLLIVAGGGWLITLRKDWAAEDFHGVPGDQVALASGIALVALGAIFQVARGWRADVKTTLSDIEVADLRVAMKDALKPVLRLVSEMPDMPAGNRTAHLKIVAERAAAVTAKLLMAQVDRPRANVFALEADGSRMRCIAFMGRGEGPGTFLAGNPASDAAIARVKAGKPLIVNDREKDPPEGHTAIESDWRSFVSVPIVSGDGWAFGMLTVDSPEAKSFVDTDKHTATVVAEILAIAFALAYPQTSRGTSSVNDSQRD